MPACLAGRVAVVTGAGRGLGRSVAAGLLAEGATVVAVARSGGELASLAAETPFPERLTLASGDLADDAFARGVIRQARQAHGRVDILVNNAAILEPQRFRRMSLDDFDRTLRVNFRAPVVLAHAVLPVMAEAGGGSIVNVGSASSYRGFDGETHYCAAKFGLEGFSEALAMEVRDDNVAVNRLTPGFLIKPTSVTLADAAAAPAEVRSTWQDPGPMVDAFTYLGLQDGKGVSGFLFDAFALAEQVREHGWRARFEPRGDRTGRTVVRVA